MKFERFYTKPGFNLYVDINWAEYTVPEHDDERGTDTTQISAPHHWSQNAVEILSSKYMRKKGVPLNTGTIEDEGVPTWLRRHTPITDECTRERHAGSVFHRIAGHWTYAGWRLGYFSSEESARIFYDELTYCLAMQIFAPNSPQWFNTGLWWAYGLEGDTINWIYRPGEGARQITRAEAYAYPQTSACFISSIDDSLIGEGGILDLLRTEASIFKYGSGSGANFSPLRAKGAPLAGGGKSSGLMSFLKVFDANAGAIKSGGTTRRAAKMVVVNADHPEAMDFVTWKAREELKVRALTFGADHLFLDLKEYGLDEDDIKLLESLTMDWESEAYQTVSGQNSNNSLRVSDNFMTNVSCYLEHRCDNEADTRDVELFRALCKSTWKCGDPGMQFDDACNLWHTIPKVGRQNATNPCSEYSFIDDSACNLASINLVKFLSDARTGLEGKDYFETDGFIHVCRLVTTVLDITVSMSSYPTAKIAENSYKYRPLGLGYANLGGLLMSLGIAYSSDMGRSLAGAITSLMQATAWRTSNELSWQIKPFFEFEAHRGDVANVFKQHCKAHDAGKNAAPESAGPDREVWLTANTMWANCTGSNLALRNAQLSLLAPTGTIGLVMDCATTGIEPDYALRKHKKLAGGGFMEFVNPHVADGLRALGYDDGQIDKHLAWVEAEGAMDIDNLDPNDAAVFHCANEIHWKDHLKMMAAVQPFLSGAISKTVNLPNSATVRDIANCYIMAWELGLKAVAPYRDGSKGAQPLTTKKKEVEGGLIGTGFVDAVRAVGSYEENGMLMGDFVPDHKKFSATADQMILTADEARERMVLAVDALCTKCGFRGQVVPDKRGRLMHEHCNYEAFRLDGPRKPGTAQEIIDEFAKKWSTPANFEGSGGGPVPVTRRKLPSMRQGITWKVKIGGHSVFLRTGEYEDGRLGEIFLDMSREGSALAMFMHALAMAVSIGLQYGVPLKEFVDAFEGTNGEPNGMVQGSDEIRFCQSVIDWVARQLNHAYREDRVRMHGKKADTIIIDDVLAPEAESPYSGDPCPNCKKFMLTRNGTCHVCRNCGETTGCS